MEQLPHAAYPRPQFRRDSYQCLNGVWAFATGSDAPPAAYPEQILVPFPPESKRSGIGRRIAATDTMWYRRTFRVAESTLGKRVLLHFGAIDQTARIFLNDREVGRYDTPYLPLTLDVTDALQTENTLVVAAVDALDHRLPWGKQKVQNGGMWYTPFSGIWQTVWLECVPSDYLRSAKITPTLHSVTFSFVRMGAPAPIELTVDTPDGALHAVWTGDDCTVEIPNPRLWSPEQPTLYPVSFRYLEDTVHAYFGLRTIETGVADGVPRLLLNGKPYFFHGLLDQGYWQDGLCLPPDADGYEQDIATMKALGFNTLRKHIRVEPLRFYAACDRLGMVVFQDFVNNGDYRFFHDTVLPTLGLQRLPDKNAHKGASRQAFLQAADGTIDHLYNAPCILYWTIFNEGWGQFCADDAYRRFKKKDATRIWDATSGWFRRTCSDVDSRHVYFRRFRPRIGAKPYVLSEFGGYAYSTDTGKRYGYRFFKTQAAYEAALVRLYADEILPAIGKGLCAAIYTQVSDVEEEQNGLLSYDRSTQKVGAAFVEVSRCCKGPMGEA